MLGRRQWIAMIITKSYITPCRNVRNVYFCQSGAVIESLISNAGDAIGNRHSRRFAISCSWNRRTTAWSIARRIWLWSLYFLTSAAT